MSYLRPITTIVADYCIKTCFGKAVTDEPGGVLVLPDNATKEPLLAVLSLVAKSPLTVLLLPVTLALPPDCVVTF